MTDYYVDEDYDEAYEDDGYDYYPEPDFVDDVDEAEQTAVEGRTSWIYLASLTGVFVLLVFFSWACNDRSDTAGEPVTEEEAATATAATATTLSFVVDGDVVTVTGAVPDEAARDQILIVTRNQYGPENVIDELEIDESTTLDDGTVSITGSADIDDDRPALLRDAIASGFGLEAAEFTIDRGETTLTSVVIEAQVTGDQIKLIGAVPDDSSVVELAAAAEAVWGEENVDVTELTVGDVAWADGVVRVTGATQLDEASLAAFPEEVRSRFGALVAVDTDEVVLELGPDALQQVEAEIAALLQDQPITFAPVSSDITPESDAVLLQIANALNTVSEVPVEVVGHTDSAGVESENLVLSRARAEAVIARLVELGIDEARLSARGEGSAIPIADNDTPEGRERNRRIEFRLVGAG